MGHAGAAAHPDDHGVCHQRPPPSDGRHTLSLVAPAAAGQALRGDADRIGRQLGDGDAGLQPQPPGFGLLLGGGLALWSFWVVGSWLGIHFGSAVSDPKRLGLDMVMGCFLLAMVVGGEKNLRMLVIWSVAAGASLLAFRYLPENSHVVVGALAGGATGLLWKEKARES